MEAIGRGGVCQMEMFEGAVHGFANHDPALDETMKQGATFLREFGMTVKRLDPLFDSVAHAYRDQDDGNGNRSNFVQMLTPPGYSVLDHVPYPVAIFLYEGPLVNGALCENDYYEMATLAERLALEKGFVVFLPDFSTPYINRVPYDTSVRDVRSAFRWIKENADMLNINTSELVAVGSGYGAHLALATTLTDKTYDHFNDNLLVSPAPAKFILLNPILDLNSVRENEEMVVHSNGFNYWAGGVETITDTDFSRMRSIRQPVWIIEGLADPTYPHLHDAIASDKSYPEAGFHFYADDPYINLVLEQIVQRHTR